MALTFLSEGSEEDYVKYLDLQGTKVEAYPDLPALNEEDATETTNSIRQVLMQKRELHDRSQKAFVSWVRAYTKTLPSDIFNLSKLDWADLACSWGLLQWPKMPELKRYFPEAVADRAHALQLPNGFQLEALKYADKVREAKRQEAIEARARGERPSLTGGKAMESKKRKERAWSSQKEVKAMKEERRERKEVRRKAERVEKMTEGERVEDMELDALIARVREQNAGGDDGEFEGFDD